MATSQLNSWYKPDPRAAQQSICVGSKVYMWAGDVNGMPEVHDSQEKRQFISCVEVFHSGIGEWTHQPTSGAPPLGVWGYSCTAVGDALHFFGGYCNHDDCYHNSIHSLSTSSLHWVELSPTTSEGGAPMKKRNRGIMAFKDGEEDILFIVAGYGPTSSYYQPGAQYEAITSDRVICNEQHMFSLSTRKWSSPNITGQPPPPCSGFTLTPVGERRAVLFGGMSGLGAYSDDLFIVELSRDTVLWTKICKPTGLLSIFRSVDCPEGRCYHATTCVSGSLLVIVGGLSELSTISDCWIGDLTKKRWKKLSLPKSVTERYNHSLSALQLSPHCVLLVIFGGRRSPGSTRLSDAVLIELIMQEDGGQWMVGMILEGAALEDKRVYQQMLSKWRSTEVDQGVIQEVEQLMQQERERAREVEQRLNREIQQLTREKEQTTREKEKVTKENEWIVRDLQLNREESQLMMRENQQLQTANSQLRQQLSVMRFDEGREDQPHWMVMREEVELTEEVVGRGGWGEVKVAKFRGLRVAAKVLHNMIISEYNLQLFTREMTIAAKIRHPNLLLFIGATREGEAIILTELMPTSLRRELHKRDIPRVQIASIAQDVACALRYLHQWRPSPIIHRDISSANVLLEPLPDVWRAKVSDYGSANFMNVVATEAPGAQIYAAPEAFYPNQQSPKMDTYSYGVLLIEMCVRRLPESSPAQREAQILQIQWATMVSLVRRCTSERPADRPSMRDIMGLLASITDQ